MARLNDINIDSQTLDYSNVENISSPILINLETSSQALSISNPFEWSGINYSYQNVQSIGLPNSTINTGSGNDVIDISTTAAASFFGNSWSWGDYSYQNVQSTGLTNSTINTGSGDDVIDISTTAAASFFDDYWGWGGDYSYQNVQSIGLTN